MPDAVHDVLLPHARDGLLNEGSMAVLADACELLGAQGLEDGLHLRECELDRVEVGAVRHVVDPLESEPLHLGLAFLASMGAQVVQKEADLVAVVR